MKRAITLLAVVALVLACCFAWYSRSSDAVSAAADKVSHAVEKVKDLLPASEEEGGQAAASEEADGWALPSLDSISVKTGVLSSVKDVVLVPTDDYAQGYVFNYDGEEFVAYFDTYSWRVYDSYKITDHGDIVLICQALLNEHPVYGSDWESVRTAEDMAFEWDQHNLAYKMLPESSHWREDAKNVDLDPDDQGKTFLEIYESRTGEKLDIRNYLPGA